MSGICVNRCERSHDCSAGIPGRVRKCLRQSALIGARSGVGVNHCEDAVKCESSQYRFAIKARTKSCVAVTLRSEVGGRRAYASRSCMHIPGNIGRYDEVPLPAFDYLEARYIQADSSRRLTAWRKAAEVERRLDHFEWLAHVARRPAGIQSFVSDLASAYLLSFEAAVQVLAAEKFPNGIEKWLGTLATNDLTFRGLRTLRHLEAHVRPSELSQRSVGGHSRFTAGEGGSNIGWQWAPIGDADFQALRTPRISAAEVPVFNQQLEKDLAMDLMRDGVERIRDICGRAEQLP